MKLFELGIAAKRYVEGWFIWVQLWLSLKDLRDVMDVTARCRGVTSC